MGKNQNEEKQKVKKKNGVWEELIKNKKSMELMMLRF